MLETSEVV